MKKSGSRENWSSHLGFILAATGSAVGLGNIWRFPYVTGQNGGGAFVLLYLACIAIIGIPVMICEITLGRHTRRNPVGAFKQLNPSSCALAHFIGLGMMLCGGLLLCMGTFGWGLLTMLMGILVFRFRWTLVGAIGVFAGFTILSFYSVVAGWTIGYIVKAVTGSLQFTDVTAAENVFGSFITHSYWPLLCHLVFMLMTIYIVYHGVRGGIEKWSKILMPVLFLLLVLLIIRGLTLPGAIEGVRFYLSPDFSKLTAQSVLEALGLAFFSLSLGMGAIITYGSYVDKNDNIFTAALAITALDTIVALLAGLAMFPAVFAMGFAPSVGPGLVFQVLPTVFNQIPLGALWAVIFFILLCVAALTSAISLLEVVTAYFIDERNWPRKKAALVCGGVIFLLGCLCAVSVADWERIKWLETSIVAIFGSTHDSFFNVMDDISSNWLLPLGGLFIALFVGWVWGPNQAIKEIRHGSKNFADVHLWSLLAGLKDDPSHSSDVHVVTLASLWGIFIRFISPVAILIAFLHTIGWLDIKRPEPEPVQPIVIEDLLEKIPPVEVE